MTLLKINNHPKPSFNGLVDELFGGYPASKWFNGDLFENIWKTYPPVNIHESKDAFILDVMAPGYEKADFKIGVEKDILTISVDQKDENESTDKKHIRKEFSYASFQRSFTLDEAVDTEKITAKYENGVLQVTLPKKEDKATGNKEIAVE